MNAFGSFKKKLTGAIKKAPDEEIYDDDPDADEQKQKQNAKLLSNRLKQIFGSPNYRPPLLPEAASRILELSRQPNIGVDEVVKVLEQDPMLTARVIKISNSAMYSGRNRIESLQQAVVRLGLNNLRDIVMDVALSMRIFRTPGYSEVMNRVRRHSIVTALCCRTVSKYTSMAGEFAFLCGLLHDIGVAAALIAISESSKKSDRPAVEGLWPAIQGIHEQAAGMLAQAWKLPPEIKLVIGHHHQVHLGGVVHPLLATLCVGETMATMLGYGIADEDSPAVALDGRKMDERSPTAYDEAARALNLTPQTQKLIRQETEDLIVLSDI